MIYSRFIIDAFDNRPRRLEENKKHANKKAVALMSTGLGAVAFLSLNFLAPTYSLLPVIGRLASLAWTQLSLSSFQHLKARDVDTFDMTRHTFTPFQCGGARLYYKKNVPVLELQGDDSYRQGYFHGYLLGSYINTIFNRLCKLYAINDCNAQTISSKLSEVRQSLLEKYVLELQGIVDGYSAWMNEQSSFAKFWYGLHTITFNELLLLHLIPEHDALFYGKASPATNVACTTILGQDPTKGIVFGRALDWNSHKVLGNHTLVIVHKNNDLTTVDIAFPSFIGTLTGINSKRFAVAMNQSVRNKSQSGNLPAVFFNRKMLETCSLVSDATELVSRNPKVITQYHLTVADSSTAATFHMHQFEESAKSSNFPTKSSFAKTSADRQMHYIHPLQEKEFRITANHVYVKGKAEMLSCLSSYRRLENFETYCSFIRSLTPKLLEKDVVTFVEGALRLSDINRPITVHAAIILPKLMKIKIAFDHSYAADRPLQEIDISEL